MASATRFVSDYSVTATTFRNSFNEFSREAIKHPIRVMSHRQDIGSFISREDRELLDALKDRFLPKSIRSEHLSDEWADALEAAIKG